MKEEVGRELPAKQLNVEYMQLDLGSFESTKRFVTTFKAKGLPLHILINNAGIMSVPFGSFIPMSVFTYYVCSFPLHTYTTLKNNM